MCAATNSARRRHADVQRQEVTLGLTGWLIGNQFNVGWNGRALDAPALLEAAQAVLPSVAKIATLEPTGGLAITALGQLLSKSSMTVTAEQMTAAVSPFRDLLDLIAVRREAMQVFSLGAIFADDVEPSGLEARVVGCHQYSAGLTRAMLAHGPAAALNQGAYMELLFIFFDSRRFDEASNLTLDLYEERRGRLVRGILVDWSTGRTKLSAPDTVIGKVRETLGTDRPIFGKTDFDLANIHITTWRTRIARGAH